MSTLIDHESFKAGLGKVGNQVPNREEMVLKELGEKEKIFIALFNAKKQQGTQYSPEPTSKVSVQARRQSSSKSLLGQISSKPAISKPYESYEAHAPPEHIESRCQVTDAEMARMAQRVFEKDTDEDSSTDSDGKQSVNRDRTSQRNSQSSMNVSQQMNEASRLQSNSGTIKNA